MELSERKKKILQLVVDDYIDDGQPVSSKFIQEKHLKDVSSATIRSELSQLEEMGYLSQPHTSSGRVPLPKAYRIYVEQLMQCKDLTIGEVDYIHSKFQAHFPESEFLVRSAAKLISEMTDYTAVGVVNHGGDDEIKNIKLVKLSESNILLIVLTDVNVIKDSMITTSFDADENYIQAAEQILNEEFVGKHLSDITNESEQLLENRLAGYKQLFENIVRVIREYVEREEKDKLVLEGQGNMFKHNEFNDIDKTKNFLSVIGSRQKLSSILENSGDIEISVKIGKDDDNSLSDDLALVTAQYKLNGKPMGSAGVLGPIRMDYNRVFRVLNMIGQTIDGLSDPIVKKEEEPK